MPKRGGGELTVKEISVKTGLPESVVFWHLMTMFKYGLIEAARRLMMVIIGIG